jgi:hypothetical protein
MMHNETLGILINKSQELIGKDFHLISEKADYMLSHLVILSFFLFFSSAVD